MNAYKKLTNYNAGLYDDFKPEYRGIEYDFEVPSNLVIGSPGGVDSVRHHYTKGFYGRGNTSSDIYAGQQQRYIAGEYGNLYNPGHSAAQAQGYYGNAPDKKYWMNQISYPSDNSIFTKEEFLDIEPDFEVKKKMPCLRCCPHQTQTCQPLYLPPLYLPLSQQILNHKLY